MWRCFCPLRIGGTLNEEIEAGSGRNAATHH